MPRVFEDVSAQLERLEERLHSLEQRIAELENRQPRSPASTAVHPPSAAIADPAHQGFLGMDLSIGAVPVLGKAVVALAGAYLLRAIAESSVVAQFPMLIAAIVYAAAWMSWSARARRTSRFASAAYAITATLILCPLLWESTVRFQLLSSSAAAAVLVGFVMLSLALAWKHNLQVLPWMATLGSVATAWALLVKTHAIVPLTVALLAIALGTELAACLGQRFSLRVAVAVAVDSIVWLLVSVMTAPGGVPDAYQAANLTTVLALCIAILLVYGGSIGLRSFGLRKQITNFEIAQGVLVFLLSSWGALRTAKAIAAPGLGTSFLLLSAVTYWGAMARFAASDQIRNRRISAIFAPLLFGAGAMLLAPSPVQVVILCVASVGTVLWHVRTRNLSLAVHASAYLAAAAVISPLPDYLRDALARAVPGAPPWTVWTVFVSAALCYVLGSRLAGAVRSSRLLWLTPAVIASLAIASMGVVALRAPVAARFELNASHDSGIRTVVTCLLALGLGFAARRGRRLELGWIAYGVVGFSAVKLLFEDLRFGSAASLVVSLLFYGLVLILLPRVMRDRTNA